MAALRVVGHVKRDSTGTAGKIKRLFGVHRERDDAVLIVDRGAKLAVAYEDVIGRKHGGSTVATDLRGREPGVVLTLSSIYEPANARNSPDIGIKTTCARASYACRSVKCVAESRGGAELQTAVPCHWSRQRCWRRTRDGH